MFEKFWQQVGTSLAGQWMARVLAPSFLFWAGGVIALGFTVGYDTLFMWWQMLSATEQAVSLFIALLVVSCGAVIVEWGQTYILRFIEGHWPFPLREWATRRYEKRKNQQENRWQELALACEGKPEKLSRSERAEYNKLDAMLLRFPSDPNLLMPTLVGNLMRGIEDYSDVRYGLDLAICWPRLWMLLPKEVQQDIENAQERLYAATRVWAWGCLFIIWTPLAWWAAPIALATMHIAYMGIANALLGYGDFIRSAFDLYRFKLYDQLGFPRPPTKGERHYGETLTMCLARGNPESEAEPELTT